LCVKYLRIQHFGDKDNTDYVSAWQCMAASESTITRLKIGLHTEWLDNYFTVNDVEENFKK